MARASFRIATAALVVTGAACVAWFAVRSRVRTDALRDAAPATAPSAAALPGATLRGRVVDLPTARGVPGARVSATGELEIAAMSGAPDRLTTTSGPDGVFVLRGLRPGVLALTATSPAMASNAPTLVPVTLGDDIAGVEVWVDLPYPVRVDVRDAGASPTRAPSPGAEDAASKGIVAGTVLDAQGRSVSGAWVTARGATGEPLGIPAFTDAAGAFSLAKLGDGPFRVSAYAMSTSARATRASVRAGDHVALTLGGLATLILHVRSSRGPLPDYDVELDGPISRRVRAVDAEGECRLRWIDPGDYALRVASGAAYEDQTLAVAPDAVLERTITLAP